MAEDKVRRISLNGLLDNDQVLLEGRPNETLPTGEVYISPATGQVRDGSRGDSLESLPPDSVQVPKTTWGLRILRRPRPSPSFFLRFCNDRWIRNLIKGHIVEFSFLATFFPELDDVELCTDQNDRIWLHGRVGELGEVIIEYHLGGDSLTYSFQFLDQAESI